MSYYRDLLPALPLKWQHTHHFSSNLSKHRLYLYKHLHPAAPAEDSTNDSNVTVEETEPAPALTPEGNVALVDDFGGNKQLITVTTKAGNYF